VRGIWAVIGALSAAIVLLAVLWWLAQRARRGKGIGLKVVLEEGAGASVMPLMNTASQVGFGAVIASLAGFALIRDAVLGIAPGNRWCPCRSRSTSWRASPARHRVA
jgi:H+/gluconate symporter-like permease